MAQYGVRAIRIRLGEGWVDLRVGIDTTLDIQAPGSPVARPGADIGPGRWEVAGVAGFPRGISDTSGHEVEIVTTDGACWRGWAVPSPYTGQLLPDSPLGAC